MLVSLTYCHHNLCYDHLLHPNERKMYWVYSPCMKHPGGSKAPFKCLCIVVQLILNPFVCSTGKQ
uniref:Uncharacterized protein n=1 Tax=Anguilla anguilla TaxID=7936 RepID=A0A0E9T8B8_ANGAN